MKKLSSTQWLWLAIFFGVLIWSGIAPKEYFTWFLEVLPAIVALIVLLITYLRFPLSKLSYGLILIHSVILMIGGHYTYAEVPFFDLLGEHMGWERNNYDKLGHFAQGFVPAMICREVFLRLEVVRKSWRAFLILCFCLALSAFYELIEWWVALATGDSAESFLGTQGYVWDTQSDMAWALLGACIALLTLSPMQDRSIRSIGKG